MADLGDEINVLFILGLLTLASLVLSIEVKETAGEDEEAAGVRRPGKMETKMSFGAKENCLEVNMLKVKRLRLLTQAQQRHQVAVLKNVYSPSLTYSPLLLVMFTTS